MTCPTPDPSSYVITLCASHPAFHPLPHLAFTGVDPSWLIVAAFAGLVVGAALMFGAYLWRASRRSPTAAQSRPEPD